MNRQRIMSMAGDFGRRRLVVLLLCWGAVLIMGCAGPEGPAEVSIDDDDSGSDFTVTDVKYVIMKATEGTNNPLVDYICDERDESEDPVSICFWFQIRYTGDDPDVGTLKTTFQFENIPQFHWVFDEFADVTEDYEAADFEKTIIDTDNTVILVRGVHSLNTTDPTLTQNRRDALPLGDLSVTVEFDNKTSENPNIQTVVGPDDADTETATYVYAEGEPSDENEIMIQPAVVGPGDRKTNALGRVNLTFTVSDERAEKFQVWFFDQSNRLIAWSDIRDIEYTDGRNSVNLTADDISSLKDDEVDLNEVTKFSILLSDNAEADINIHITQDGCVSFSPIYSF